MVQISQELGRKHWATHLSVRSFACTAHSFACSALLALLAHSAALIRLLVCSVAHSRACGKVGILMSQWIEGAMSLVKGPKAKLRDLETRLKWKSLKQETLGWSFWIWIGLSALKSGPLVGRQGPPFRRQGFPTEDCDGPFYLQLWFLCHRMPSLAGFLCNFE